MKYDNQAGWRRQKCEICEFFLLCCQHHIGHRRYSPDVIWICQDCHDKVHNPTAHGLPADWAYQNGYLVRHNTSYKIKMKEPKKKVCTHSKSYYQSRLDAFICSYCGQKVTNLNFGTKKAKVATEAKIKPSKMGYEKQDPRIAQAEQLKRKYTSLTIKIKLAATSEDIEALKQERNEVKQKMLELQATYA